MLGLREPHVHHTREADMRRQGRAPPWVAVHGIYCITVLRRWGDSGERVLLPGQPAARAHAGSPCSRAGVAGDATAATIPAPAGCRARAAPALSLSAAARGDSPRGAPSPRAGARRRGAPWAGHRCRRAHGGGRGARGRQSGLGHGRWARCPRRRGRDGWGGPGRCGGAGQRALQAGGLPIERGRSTCAAGDDVHGDRGNEHSQHHEAGTTQWTGAPRPP